MIPLLRRNKPATRDQDGADQQIEATPDALALQAAHRHLALAPDGTWAFFVMSTVDWLHKTPEQRDAIIASQTHRWADLAGCRVWLRGTGAPFDYEAWAERVAREHPQVDGIAPGGGRRRKRLADKPNARSFDDLLVAGQALALGLAARKSAVVLGVRFTTDKMTEHDLPDLLSKTELGDSRGLAEAARRKLATVTTAVTRDGFRAQPLAPKALEWLIHSSLGMGSDVPPVMLTATAKESWDATKMPGFTAGVYATSSPYGLTTRLRTVRRSQIVDKHVAVLHADVIGDRDPQRGGIMPLLAWAQSLDQPVEWVAVFDVANGRTLKREAEYDRRKAINIAKHHLEHEDDPPAHIRQGIDRARQVEDEVTVGDRATACRMTGVLLFAVVGNTAEAACAEAEALTVTAAEQQSMALYHDFGQRESYRSFTPCEPVRMTGHMTRWPAYFAGGAVPNASTSGGDPTGFPVGNIAGGHDLFLFDTHGGPARNRSGMALFVCDQGGGKSTAAGALADWTTNLGIPTICLDPSGPWARLTQMPHLKGDARHLDVSGMSPGAFAPSTLIADPPLASFDTTAEWQAACGDAGRERMDLIIDTLRDLLPYELVSGRDSGRLMASIETAVAKTGGEYGTNPWEYVDALARQGELGKEAAGILTAKAALKDGALIFPPRHRDVDDTAAARMLTSAMLTVVTMRDLVLPPKGATDRASWTRAQLASVPILNLGARFATRAVYQDRDPKAVFFDEMAVSTNGGGSFATFCNRLSADSRKWNVFAAILAQNPATILGLDANIGNLAGSAWIGRMGDPGAARDALDLLRLPADSGYDMSILRLEQGEFLVRSWTGEVRRVVVDRSWWNQDLLDALDTTAGGEGQYADAPGGLFGVA